MISVYRFAGTTLLAVAGSAILNGSLSSGCGYGSSAGGDSGGYAATGTTGSGTTGSDTTGSGTTGSGTTGSGTTGSGTTGSDTTGSDTTGSGTTGSGTTGSMTGTTGDTTGTTGTTGDTTGTTGTAGNATGTSGTGATGTSGSATGMSGTGMTGTSGTGTTGTTGTGTTPAWGTPVAGGPTGTGTAAMVTVNPATTVGTIGPEFVGFSYEKTHITNDSLTSSNAALIALYKLLGSPVMRLGADDVDNCNWTGTAVPSAQPSGKPFQKVIGTAMVDQLCGFLAATGTKIIYAVNYKSDNVTASAAEAAYAQGKCGSSISGFEIGNEINRYAVPAGSWESDKTQWEAIATAIVATPGAMLIGPATGGGDALSCSTPFAADESAKFGSKLVLLTQHYYAGTANTATATAARLQTPDPDPATSEDGLVGTDTTMNTAVVNNKIAEGYRLGEVNSFAGHGQMGVSDTLIAGLWSLDLMFVTAEHGGSGVNLHGGETGMDGSNPFYYEPIMENNGVVVQVQPVYYGMLLFSLAGTGPMVSTTTTTSGQFFTAYAIKANGFTSVVLDNKNATAGISATVDLGAPVNSASAIYLQGTPAGTLTAAASAVTLAGAQVTADGGWKRNPPYTQTTSGNTVSVYIPAASAALVRVQ